MRAADCRSRSGCSRCVFRRSRLRIRNGVRTAIVSTYHRARAGSARSPRTCVRHCSASTESTRRRRRSPARVTLSTFGLISPGKQLETAIEALPAIVERHAEIVYVIAGRTHPDVARREGERYRVMLERGVLELDLDEH